MLVNVHGVVIVNGYGVIGNSCGEKVNNSGPMVASASRAALNSDKSWDPVIANSYDMIVKSYGVIVNVSQWSWCDNE